MGDGAAAVGRAVVDVREEEAVRGRGRRGEGAVALGEQPRDAVRLQAAAADLHQRAHHVAHLVVQERPRAHDHDHLAALLPLREAGAAAVKEREGELADADRLHRLDRGEALARGAAKARVVVRAEKGVRGLLRT